MDFGILKLLVLPLLGGYIFCIRCHWTSFAARRADGQRLIYGSSIAGLAFLLLARAFRMASKEVAANPELEVILTSWLTFATGVLAMSSGSLLLGFWFAPQFRKEQRRRVSICGAIVLIAGLSLLILFHSITLLGAIGTAALVLAIMRPIDHLATVVAEKTKSKKDLQAPARVVLLFPAVFFLLTFLVLYGPALAKWWPTFSDIKYSGISMLAVIIGAILWMPVNVLFPRNWSHKRAHERGFTTGLEHLFYRAFRERLPIQLTLNSGKVYTGFLLQMPKPIAQIEGSCLEFLPASSGYRDPITQMITTTDNYAKTILKILEKTPERHPLGPESSANRIEEISLQLDRLLKAVPLDAVEVASIFDSKFAMKDRRSAAKDRRSSANDRRSVTGDHIDIRDRRIRADRRRTENRRDAESKDSARPSTT